MASVDVAIGLLIVAGLRPGRSGRGVCSRPHHQQNFSLTSHTRDVEIGTVVQPPPPAAIICAGPALGVVLVELTRSAGFEVTAVMRRAADAAVDAARTAPAAVVIDVASAGTLGTGAVSLVRRLSPSSAVIALVPFPELADGVLALGATAVLHEDDLRRLPALLRQARSGAAARTGSDSTKPRPAT